MADDLQIILKNGTPAEIRKRLALLAILEKYDVSGWIFTNTVEVDETAMPHSHPVLTLNAEDDQDEPMCLATFVHEQLHWFEEQHAESRDRAIEETVQYYPEVPSARPEGAGSEYSTRLHLLVCHLEHEAMRRLLGPEAARQVIDALSRHHYRWVYRTVLSDGHRIGEIIRKYDLLPAPLRARGALPDGGEEG